MGSIYSNPSMHSSEFDSIYLNYLLEKLSDENKKIILTGDFSIDLLKYDTHYDSSDFLDAYVFSNMVEDGSISGKLVTVISDYYARCLLMESLSSENNTEIT